MAAVEQNNASTTQTVVAVVKKSWGVRIAIVTVIILIIVWITATWHNFVKSPWGQALKTTLGTASTVLYSMLNNPLAWLIGLGLVWALGPTVLEIGGTQLKRLFNRIRSAVDTDSAKTSEDQLTDAQKEIVVNKLVTEAKIETTNDNTALDEVGREQTVQSLNDAYDNAVKGIQESQDVSDEEVDGAEHSAEEAMNAYPE